MGVDTRDVKRDLVNLLPPYDEHTHHARKPELAPSTRLPVA